MRLSRRSKLKLSECVWGGQGNFKCYIYGKEYFWNTEVSYSMNHPKQCPNSSKCNLR